MEFYGVPTHYLFDDGAIGISSHMEQFTYPREAFSYFFDGEVIDKLCEWMNSRTNKCFAATGKRKLNGHSTAQHKHSIQHTVYVVSLLIFIMLLLLIFLQMFSCVFINVYCTLLLHGNITKYYD